MVCQVRFRCSRPAQCYLHGPLCICATGLYVRQSPLGALKLADKYKKQNWKFEEKMASLPRVDPDTCVFWDKGSNS